MSSALPDLTARVRLDTTDLDKGIKRGAAFGSAIGSALGGLASGGLQAAISGVRNFALGSVDAFAAVEDATGAAGVQFGKALPSVLAFADKASASFGLSKRAALEAQNTFGTLGKAAGLQGGELAGFSQKLTGLAGDLASFKGTSTEQAIEAVGAALRGESEPIRAYGVLLDDATLRQEALALGLIKTTKDALTPQQKALAAQSAILKQTTDAQGDYARTSDSTANVQKTLAAETENASAKLGAQLAPAVTAARKGFLGLIKGLSGAVAVIGPAIGQVVGTVQGLWDVLAKGDFTGIPGLEEDSPIVDALFDMREAAVRLVDAFRDNVLPVLERVGGFLRDNLVPILAGVVAPILVAVTGAIGGALVGALVALVGALASPVVLIGALVAALVFAYRESETFRAVVAAVMDFLVGTAAPAVAAFAGVIVEAIGKAVAFVRDKWPQIKDDVARVLDAVRAYIDVWVAVLTTAWRLFGDDVLRVVRGAFDAVKATVENVLQVIKGVVNLVMGVITGDWSRAWDGIKGILGGVLDQVGALVKLAFTVLRSAFGAGLSALGAAWGLAWDAIKTVTSAALSAVVEFVTGLPGRIVGALSSLAGKLAAVATAAWGAWDRAVDTAIAAALSVIRALPGQIVSGLGNLGGLLVNAGRELMEGLARGIREKISAVVNEVQDAVAKIARLLPGSPVKDGPLTSWNNGGAGKRLMGLLADGITAGAPAVRGAMERAVTLPDLAAGAAMASGAGLRAGGRPGTLTATEQAAQEAASMREAFDRIAAEVAGLRADVRALPREHQQRVRAGEGAGVR